MKTIEMMLVSAVLFGCGGSATPAVFEFDAGQQVEPCVFEGEDGAQFAPSTTEWQTPACLPDGGRPAMRLVPPSP